MKTKSNQQDKFQIIFDGSAFTEGNIRARVFAKSLLALDDIFSVIVKEKYGPNAEIHLQITAITPGSFLVDILCSMPQEGWGDIPVSLFTTKEISAIVNVITLVFGARGLFKVFKYIKGRAYKIKKDAITIMEGKEEVDSRKFPPEVLSASQKVKTLKALNDFTTPLIHEGYDVIKLKYRSKNKNKKEDIDLEITKKDREYLNVTAEDSEEQTRFYDVKWVIVTVSLEGDYKWRFRDEQGNYYAASILDKIFLSSIADGNERFGRDDCLKCKIREEAKIESNLLKRLYYVEEVLEKYKREDSDSPNLF